MKKQKQSVKICYSAFCFIYTAKYLLNTHHLFINKTITKGLLSVFCIIIICFMSAVIVWGFYTKSTYLVLLEINNFVFVYKGWIKIKLWPKLYIYRNFDLLWHRTRKHLYVWDMIYPHFDVISIFEWSYLRKKKRWKFTILV